MRLFRRKTPQPTQPMPASGGIPSNPQPVPNDQAVIARYSLSGGAFGGPGERDAFAAMEELLIERIESARVGEYDGNEFGGSEAVVYMYGPDADLLFETIESHLRQFSARPAHCVLRYGGVNDPNVRERRIDL